MLSHPDIVVDAIRHVVTDASPEPRRLSQLVLYARPLGCRSDAR
jgi:hypothetical protein